MKLIFVIFIMIISLSVLADTKIAEIDAYKWNKFINNLEPLEMILSYDAESDNFFLTIPDGRNYVKIEITEEYREELYKLLRSFDKKANRAKSWNETLDEELGQLPTAESYFKKGEDVYSSRVNSKVNIFSQSTDLHQMVFFFSKMTARENETYFMNSQAIYFWQIEAAQMKKVFKKKNFDKYRETSSKSQDS